MGTRVEVDETGDILLVEKKSLLGLITTRKLIPLSRIEKIRVSSTSELYGLGDGRTGYHCDLLVDGFWKELMKEEREQSVLRAAAAIGRVLENRHKHNKLQALADYLSNLFGATATVVDEASLGSERYRRPAYPISLKSTRGVGWTNTGSLKMLTIYGRIRLQGHVIDSIEVLHSDTIDAYYVLAYIIGGKAVQSTWTNRKRKYPPFGEVIGVEWEGGPLTDQLNSDLALKRFLVRHLKNPDCDAYITSDLSSGSTMIIFGDSYPPQWERLPRELFPNKDRIRAVTLLAEKTRSIYGIKGTPEDISISRGVETVDAVGQKLKNIEIYIDRVKGHFRRAIDCKAQGEYDNAIVEYTRVVELDNNSGLAYFNRGSLFMLQGKKADAIVDFERVIELSDGAALSQLAKYHIEELRS